MALKEPIWFHAAGGVVAALLLLSFGFPCAEADERAQRLTADQHEALMQGKSVIMMRTLDDWPWSEVSVYRWVDADPVAVAAVHADFDSHKLWSPGIVVSRVVKRPAPDSAHVYFEFYIRVVPNEQYTLATTTRPSTNGYVTSWNLVEARYARRISGELAVEPLGAGSLVVSINRVDPGAFGRLGSEQSMIDRTERTLKALGEQVERLRAQHPENVAELVRAFSDRMERSK